MTDVHQRLQREARRLLRHRFWRFWRPFSLGHVLPLSLLLLTAPLLVSWGAVFPILWWSLVGSWLWGSLMHWWRESLLIASPLGQARFLEDAHPSLTLRLQSALEFDEAPAKEAWTEFLQQAYKDQVVQLLEDMARRPYATPRPTLFWLILVLGLGVTCLRLEWLPLFLGVQEAPHGKGVWSPVGWVHVYEPQYTGLVSRTLPLSGTRLGAYQQSRVVVELEEPVARVLVNDAPSQGVDGHRYEQILTEETTLVFIDRRDRRTLPLVLIPEADAAPILEWKEHSEPGAINIRSTLDLAALVRDDFGVDELTLVVQTGKEEQRLPLNIPRYSEREFLTETRWAVSELVAPGTEAFSLYLEAKDNNLLSGPGVGQSPVLSFELDSPQRRFEEMRQTARALLDQLLITLADHLESPPWSHPLDFAVHAGHSTALTTQIMIAQDLLEQVLAQAREADNAAADLAFFEEMQRDMRSLLGRRSQLSEWWNRPLLGRSWQPGQEGRMQQWMVQEETQLEHLTYDLMMKLKFWAFQELQGSKEHLATTLEELSDLLEQADLDNPQERDEVAEAMRQKLDELMKQLSELMQKMAQDMDMTLSEFINQESLSEANQELKDIRQQLEEALRQGDLEKAQKIMEALQQAMEAMMRQMEQAMGQMSPEMQAMMESLRELQGLLATLKEDESALEVQTRTLMEALGLTSEQMAERSELLALARELEALLVGYEERTRELSPEHLSQWVQTMEPPSGAPLMPDAEGSISDVVHFFSPGQLNRFLDEVQNLAAQAEELRQWIESSEWQQAKDRANRMAAPLQRQLRFHERHVPAVLEQNLQGLPLHRQADSLLTRIRDLLHQMQQSLDQRRAQLLRQRGEQDHERQSEEQERLRELLQAFLEEHGQRLQSFPFEGKLRQIDGDMQVARESLQRGHLSQGHDAEQRILQQLGEMQDQMQQMMQPGQQPGGMPMSFLPQRGMPGYDGDPTGALQIPKAQRRLRQNAIKNLSKKYLQGPLPQEDQAQIRRYYERLLRGE